MLFTLLFTVLAVTSGEDTHYSEGKGHLQSVESVPPPSGLAGSGSQEERGE